MSEHEEMMTISIFDPSTFDQASTDILNSNSELIRSFHHEENRIDEQYLASDRTRPRAENPFYTSYQKLVRTLADHVLSQSILGWHYTRMTDSEVERLLATGIEVSTIESLISRLDEQVREGNLSENEKLEILAASPLNNGQSDVRENRFWLVSCPYDPADGSVKLLVGNWGGEAAYFWLDEHSPTAERLRSLGRGRIISVKIPVSMLEDYQRHSIACAMIASRVRQEGIHAECGRFDFCVREHLSVDKIVDVISDDHPDYSSIPMTVGCAP